VLTANHYWLDGLVALTLLACCLPILIGARKFAVAPRRAQVT
jgi:hypothetical protein